MTAKAQAAPIFKATDRYGNLLSGGLVYTYDAGTSDPKETFQDSAAATPHANPVVLDTAGEAAIYFGVGLYRIVVKDANGITQWQVDPYDAQVADTPAPSASLIDNGGFEADSDGDGTPDGWVFSTYTGGTADVDRYDAGTNPTPDTFDGEAAIRFVTPGGSGNGGGYATQADYFEVGEVDPLDVSFALKCSAVNVHVKVDVLWYTAAKAAHGTPQTTLYNEAAANPTTWTEYAYKVTPPAGARFAKLRFYGGVDDNVNAGTIRFDRARSLPFQPQYVRSDEADTISGALTFNGALTINATATYSVDARLNNNVSLLGKDTGGSTKLLAKIGSDNYTYFGDTGIATRVNTSTNIFRWNGASSYQVWDAGNDGSGSGCDADLLDGVQGASYARKDVAAGDQSFDTINLILSNSKALLGKETGGTQRNLANVNGSNAVVLGDSAVATRIRGTALTFSVSDYTVWHSGNDGSGSGLDADTLDGSQLSDLQGGSAASGFMRVKNTYYLDGTAAVGTILSLQGVITESAWETVGPTGSGADNIWTALDALPSAAIGVIVELWLAANATIDLVNNLRVGLCKGGYTVFHHNLYCEVTGDGTSDFENQERMMLLIPLDSSRRFAAWWGRSDASLDVITSMWVKGYVE